MTLEELKQIENESYKMLELTLYKARAQYAIDNARFKVGDYVRSVTGIIKVETIKHETFINETHIVYCGYKYWYKDKQLVRTQKKEQVCITDYGNLIKVEL